MLRAEWNTSRNHLAHSVMTRLGQVVSVDLVWLFKVRSINNSLYGLAFIKHFTNMPFLYALKSTSKYPKYLKQFLLDFREMFADQWPVHYICILQYDNANELQSAQVQAIASAEKFSLQHSNPREQFQNGKAEKCIGYCWSMTCTSLLFCSVPRHCGNLLGETQDTPSNICHVVCR